MNFKKSYKNASDKLKIKFLDAIIGENKELQTAFVNFAGEDHPAQETYSFEQFSQVIAETQKTFTERFEQVDLENPDWDSYTPIRSGYVEEWEAYQAASEQEFENIFDIFQNLAIDKIIQQKLTELTAMLIGLYEASLDADVPDTVYSFDDVNQYLLSEHTRVTDKIVEKIGMSAISNHAIIQSFEMFFRYCDEEYPGNEHFAGYFEDFLLGMAGKCDQPGRILSILDQATIDRKAVSRLVLLLNKMAGNSSEWLNSAKQYYNHNNEVALQLLEYYFEQDANEFIRLARELFNKDKIYWAGKIADFATPGLDKDLFVDVNYQLVKSYRKIDDYHKLRPHLTPEILENLLRDINRDNPFKVQVLAAEERYEEIKAIVENYPDDWEYTQLIRPILEVFPEFCFTSISRKARRTLENERGRSTYQRIVEWLQLADTIPGYKAENRLLARELYNHKPNLPALKDELRKGGLV
ncbi:MAG: hypothetical protein ACLFPE_15735 [Bacteroidales bacterium]